VAEVRAGRGPPMHTPNQGARDAGLRGETIEAEILYQYAEQYFRALREQE
jgi:Domain of unknown function (DUF4167)